MYITDENEIKALEKIILEKRLFRNQGLNCETECSKFEQQFAKKMDSKYALLVTSGTNALISALKALDIGAGDEVIIPSYTFFATAVAVVNAGAIPVIANIDDHLSIDFQDINLKISPKTKAIIAVHMDGRAAEMDEILKIAHEKKLKVIEDVAQAVGGKYKGRPLGSMGDIGCFSFNVDKIISAGEGGAIITNNEEYYKKCLITQDACCVFGATYKEYLSTIKPFIGQSMRVSEITGAMMSIQLKRLDDIIEKLNWAKKILEQKLIAAGIKVIASNDSEGDCGTSLYLEFRSIENLNSVLKKINNENLIAIPVLARPATFCWQWMHLLIDIGPKEYYQKANFMKSFDVVSRTAKINIPFECDEVSITALSKKIIESSK